MVPLSRLKNLLDRWHHACGPGRGDATARVMHLRSLDPKRITRHVGVLDVGELTEISARLRVLFGLERMG